MKRRSTSPRSRGASDRSQLRYGHCPKNHRRVVLRRLPSVQLAMGLGDTDASADRANDGFAVRGWGRKLDCLWDLGRLLEILPLLASLCHQRDRDHNSETDCWIHNKDEGSRQRQRPFLRMSRRIAYRKYVRSGKETISRSYIDIVRIPIFSNVLKHLYIVAGHIQSKLELITKWDQMDSLGRIIWMRSKSSEAQQYLYHRCRILGNTTASSISAIPANSESSEQLELVISGSRNQSAVCRFSLVGWASKKGERSIEGESHSRCGFRQCHSVNKLSSRSALRLWSKQTLLDFIFQVGRRPSLSMSGPYIGYFGMMIRNEKGGKENSLNSNCYERKHVFARKTRLSYRNGNSTVSLSILSRP